MKKDVRKPFRTFWRTQFLQGVIFEDVYEKHGFQEAPRAKPPLYQVSCIDPLVLKFPLKFKLFVVFSPRDFSFL